MFGAYRKNAMLHRRMVTVAGLGMSALTLLAVACGDATTSPRGMSTGSSLRSTTLTSTLATTVNGLLWTKPVSQMTQSAVIGPAGGSVSIPNGVRLIVPKGAVSTNVTFSVTRLPGTIVAYDFQPHGTTFAQPLTVQQPTLGTNLFKLDPATSIQGAYFLGTSLLNETTGTAAVAEFEPTFVSADKAWVTFTVNHFSGYIIATGRSGAQ
jgi:hypothetical protein